MVSEQRNPAPNGATVARMHPGGNGRRTITRDYHRLINECTEKLLSNPAHTLAMRLRAQSYRMLGEDDAALADYNSLLALEPTNVDALFYRGTILERQQRIDEAIQCYTAVLQHEPHHHKALYNRAVCYSAKGSFAQAIEDFSAAIELDQQTCKGARRLRDQDPAQQQLASSLGAAADAAAAAVLHGIGGGKPHAHALPHHLLQHHGAEGGPALSSTNSVSDASAAGWDRWTSNASVWSTTPQSAASEEEVATAASGAAGSGVNAMYDAHGAPHTGSAGTGYPSASSASQGHAYPEGAGVLVTARSNVTNTHPHTAAPPPSEAGAPPPSSQLPDHHDLHNPDQHGRSYRHLRQRQLVASGLADEELARFAEEEQRLLQQQQQSQEPSVHDSLGSWLEPRQSGGSTDAAWGQGVMDGEPPGSTYHCHQQQRQQKPQEEGLPASAQLLAALQDAKALQRHQQAQRQQQQQQQQVEDEYVLEQLQSMFVAAQEDEQEGMLGRQAAGQKNPSHLNAAAAARGTPHGVLREVQGQGLGVSGRSNTPKGRVAVAAQRGTAGPGAVLGPWTARPHAAQGRPPGPARSQPQFQVQLSSRSAARGGAGGGAGPGTGFIPPGLGRELRSPSPFERIVQDDRISKMAGATAAAGSGLARHVRNNSTGSTIDRGGTPPSAPLSSAPSNLRASSFSSSHSHHQPPPQPPQAHQQQQQVTLPGQGAPGRPRSASQQWQQQQPASPRGLRDSYQVNGGGEGHDQRGEAAPQANGKSDQAQQLNGAGRGSLGTSRELEALQCKAANGAPGLLGLGGFGSGDGDQTNGCIAVAAGRGGGEAGPEGTEPGPGDSALDPWVVGGHGGMAAALEMSRPSTSSSAASDPSDQNSRHKVIEQLNARAFALRQQGKLVEAVREYSRALELDPYHFKTLFNRGFTYDRLGELVAAVEDYTQALAVDPQSSYAHYNRGITRDRLQDFAGAVEDFTAAIRLEPNSADFYHNRGFALRKQGMFEAAINDYTMAIMLNPNHCRAFYNRAFCHDRLNHVQPAIDDYTKALEMEPNNATALHNRGSLHERNSRSDLALQDFDQAIRVDPNCAQSYNARGMLLQHLGRLEEAQADLDMAVALMQPPSASLFRTRAQIRRERGDHYGAVQDLTRAIALDPVDLLSYSRRAHCFRRMGEYESAIRDYTRAIALSPNNPKLHTIRAYCYAMIEWYGEAVADYDVVLALEPGNAHAGYNRSIALEKLGGAIDRAAAELSAAAAAGNGAAAPAGAPPERARPQSSSAQAGGQGGPGGRGGPIRSHSQSPMAVASPELSAAGGDYGVGAPGPAAAAAVPNGMPRSVPQVQGMPPPKQAWASMDGRHFLQQPQQQQQPGPPPVAARMSAGASLGSGSAAAAAAAAASFRGPSPMRGGGGAVGGPASASGRTAATWGSGHPAAAATAAGGLSAQGMYPYRGSQGSAQGVGGLVNGPGSVYRSQQFQPQQQPQQPQQQWFGVDGGPMSNGVVHGGRSRTPHRIVAVP